MASNISSSAGFTSLNMKPVSGEQADAIWAQNIADNTGYLRRRPNFFIGGYGTEGVATTTTSSDFSIGVAHNIYFNRWEGHNYLYGTFVGNGVFTPVDAPDCYATQGFLVYGNLGTYSGLSNLATNNIGGTFSFGSTFAFGLDLTSYVSIGSWATLTLYYSGTARDWTSITPNVATYRYGTPAKVYTTWV